MGYLTPTKDMYDRLMADGYSDLAVAVSGRFYYVRNPERKPAAPRTVVPAIRMRLVSSTKPAKSHSGWGGVQHCRWQFDIFDATVEDAYQLAALLEHSLEDAGVAAEHINTFDGPDVEVSTTLYHVIVEAYGWFDEGEDA